MNDDSIREQFASMRRADTASAPSFAQVTDRDRNRNRHGFHATPWTFGLAASIVLAGAVMVVVRVAPPKSPQYEPPSASIHASAPMLADWRAPTDFLLATPGHELLNTIPDLRPNASGLGRFPPTLMITPVPRAGQEQS